MKLLISFGLALALWAQPAFQNVPPTSPLLDPIVNGKIQYSTGTTAPTENCRTSAPGQQIHTARIAGVDHTYICTAGGWLEMLLSNQAVLSVDMWEDIRVPVNALAPGATPADIITYGPSGSLRVRGFDGTGTLESMEGAVQLPHAWKQGSDIHPHVHWSPTSGATCDVKWFMEYAWVNIGADAPAANTTTSVVQAAAAIWRHQLASFPSISGVGKTISSMFTFRIYRDPGDSQDTCTADAALLEFDIHIQVDGYGSKNETSK